MTYPTKIAILADTHANYPALQAVAEHIDHQNPDMVIVLGDVVNRGPRPLECLQFVLEKQQKDGWLLLRGNHEDYVINHTKVKFEGVEAEMYQNSRWTYEQLNREVMALNGWPFSMSFGLGQSELRIAHASMRHNRDGVYPETTDEVLRSQLGPYAPALFAVGHTHKPLARCVDNTLVVNVGSAGLPFDGDPRVSYAMLEEVKGGWKAEILRLDYDHDQANRDFDETGFMDNSGAMARLIRVELRVARSQIAEWAHEYEKAVLAGELSLDESVTRFLGEEGVEEQPATKTG